MHQYLFYLHEYGWKNARTKQRAYLNCKLQGIRRAIRQAGVCSWPLAVCALFAWLISHQPTVLFSQNKPATGNQPAVLFSQNKPASAISHQPNEQADGVGAWRYSWPVAAACWSPWKLSTRCGVVASGSGVGC
jgi:hypothetical protein